MQNLLVSGRKKEALLCAQEGQLWGPALILASQLGEQVWLLFRVVISFLADGFIFEMNTVKFLLKLAPLSWLSHTYCHSLECLLRDMGFCSFMLIL